MKPRTKVFSVRIPLWVYYRVRKIAKYGGWSINSLINMVLRDFIKHKRR